MHRGDITYILVLVNAQPKFHKIDGANFPLINCQERWIPESRLKYVTQFLRRPYWPLC
jgi:hypothetical protein